MLNKFLTFFDKATNIIMVIFFLLLLLIGGYAFLDSYIIYDTSALDDEVMSLKPKVDEDFNFEALREINPDVEGWITLFGTTVDYPILHSKDNLEYLNLDYRRNYTTGGSIFSDYRNHLEFADDYTILYGHNMMTGQMFSDIKKYENPEYFNQHLYGVLYTDKSIYKVEAIALSRVNAFEDDVYNLVTYINGRNSELVDLVNQKAVVKATSTDYPKLILLSTCDSYGSNDRVVLLAKLTNTSGHEIEQLEREVKKSAEADGGEAIEGTKFITPADLKLWFTIIILVIIALYLARKICEKSRKNHKNKS